MSKSKDDAVKRSTTEAVKKADKGDKKKVGERLKNWFRDLKAELKKVIWPTRGQVVNNTWVALVVIAVFAVVLAGFDWVASRSVELLIELVQS